MSSGNYLFGLSWVTAWVEFGTIVALLQQT